MALLERAERFPDVVEGEYFRDGNVQPAFGYQRCEFRQHVGVGGVSVARCPHREPFGGGESMMVSTRSGATPNSSTASSTYPPPKKSRNASIRPFVHRGP